MKEVKRKAIKLEDLSYKDRIKLTQRSIVTAGYKISDSQYYSSPRISSEIMDCSTLLTFDHMSACLPPKTKILMFDGREKCICNIKEGDLILSYNIEENKVETSEVTHKMSRSNVTELIQVTIENGIILELTEEHPIFIKDIGWVEAKDLQENMEILFW